MKKNKRTILLFIVIVSIVGWTSYKFYRKQEEVFLRYNYYYEVTNEKVFWRIDYPYKGKGKFYKIKDYTCNKELDPLYKIDQDETNNCFIFNTHIVPNIEINFSKGLYKLDNKEKEVDLGKYHITYHENPKIDDYGWEYRALLEEKENRIRLGLHTSNLGKLVKIECVNPNMNIQWKYNQKIKQNDEDIKEYDEYFINFGIKEKGYDRYITNLRYTFSKDGKETVYTGNGSIVIDQNAKVLHMNYFNYMSSIE